MLKAVLNWVRGSVVVLIAFVVLASVILSTYYTVAQNEAGAVIRFGKLISTEAVEPGLHFKLPFVDSVHTIRTSIDNISIPDVKVKTIDNQFVSVDLNLTYKTSNVFKALFQVGDMGSSSISDKVIPFVKSRTLDVFGQVNALEIADKKKTLETSILTTVQASVDELFGLHIEDIQIIQIGYDENFEKNIQITVQTRNQQLSAQNILKVKETEAQQAVAVAKGEADAAAASADGQKRVAIAGAEARAQSVRLTADAAAYDTVKRAEADAEAKKAVGTAEAEVISIKTKAAGSADAYAAILRAEASKNWQGSVPAVQLGGTSGQGGATPVVVLPSEALKPASPAPAANP